MRSNGSKEPTIAIVGAGFAGLLAAKVLLTLGFKVVLFEEHKKVGYPEHCTGLVSGKVIRLIGTEALNSIINKYSEINICYLNECLKLGIKEGLYKLDRVRLERELLETVRKLGGTIYFNTKVLNIDHRKGEIYTKDFVKRYDAILLSEGFWGKLRRKLGIGLPENYRPLIGVNFEVEGSYEEKEPKVIFGTKMAPDFFVWFVPLKRSRYLIGAASRYGARFKKLVNNKKVLKVYGGPVITGPPAKKIRAGNVIVIGDSAGLNKPLTGGGLYPISLTLYRFKKMWKHSKINDVTYMLSLLEKSEYMVINELMRAYKIAGTLYRNQKLLRYLVSTASSLYERIPDVEYDDHARALIELLIRSPLTSLKVIINFITYHPFTALKGIRDLFWVSFYAS